MNLKKFICPCFVKLSFFNIHFKIRKNFNQGLYYGDDDYDFDDWNRDAKVDGWICRNDLDCTWIDRNLGCDDRSFSSSQIRVGNAFTVN